MPRLGNELKEKGLKKALMEINRLDLISKFKRSNLELEILEFVKANYQGEIIPKMAITDTVYDMWHSLEDKAWSLADFLEDKGIPIASFCEDKGISPLILLSVVVVAIILLLAVLGGAGLRPCFPRPSVGCRTGARL